MTVKKKNNPVQETAPDNNILDFVFNADQRESTNDDDETGQADDQEEINQIKAKISLDDKSFDKILKDWRESLAEFNQLNSESRTENGLRETSPTKPKNIITNKAGTGNTKRIHKAWQDNQEPQPKQDEAKVKKEEPANKPKPHPGKTIQISSQKGIRDFNINKKQSFKTKTI